MRLSKSVFALLILVLISRFALADSAASAPISVRPTSRPNENRDYRLAVATVGNMPNPDGTGLIDATHTAKLKVRLNFKPRDKDGLLPLIVSLVEGELQVGDQKMMTGPDFYPPITLLLDRDYRLQSVIGLTGSRFEHPKPGINYANLVMLLMLPDNLISRSVGDTWKTTFRLPGWNVHYEFENRIEAVNKMDDTECVSLTQFISARCSSDREEKWMTTAVVRSAFSTADGSLVKSHADCKVVFGDPVANKPVKTASANPSSSACAEIKLDIVRVK
jgi:hypothetical protein